MTKTTKTGSKKDLAGRLQYLITWEGPDPEYPGRTLTNVVIRYTRAEADAVAAEHPGAKVTEKTPTVMMQVPEHLVEAVRALIEKGA